MSRKLSRKDEEMIAQESFRWQTVCRNCQQDKEQFIVRGVVRYYCAGCNDFKHAIKYWRRKGEQEQN